MTTNVHKPRLSLCRIVKKILPWKFRRLLVLGGTYGALSSLEEPLREHAQELGQALNLSSDTSSVKGAVSFHSILVAKFNNLNTEIEGKRITLKDVVSRKLTDEESRALANQLVKNVHPSLQYKQPSIMVDDFMRLFAFTGRLLHFRT